VRRAAVLCIALGVGACGAAPAEDESHQFLAFPADFRGFRAWPSSVLDGDAPAGGVHLTGPRTTYLNAAPPQGATAYPRGTLVVKTLADGTVFAMAKRGEGYNPSGAVGWEFFELQELADAVSIVWRGVGPPVGEKYGGDPEAGCNGCHAVARANDSLLSPSLRLGSAP
jgi:hypothetical protein